MRAALGPLRAACGCSSLGLALLCSWLAGGRTFAAPFHEPSLYTPARLEVLGVRLLNESPHISEAVLLVDYRYDGFGGSPAELFAVVTRNGEKGVRRWFRSERVSVGAGETNATIKVTFGGDSPSAPFRLATDTVTVWALHERNRAVLAVRPFQQVIQWQHPDVPTIDETPARAAAGTAVKSGSSVSASERVDQPASAKARTPDAEPDASGRRREQANPSEIRKEPPPHVGGHNAAAQVSATKTLSKPEAEASGQLASAAVQRPLVDDVAAMRGSLAATPAAQPPEWLNRLTLGPGDVLNLALFGEPESARNEVFVGPDGQISYLEAQDVQAAGLTVDELREKLDAELAKYRRAPRTIVTPVAFQSKKYFMLGRIARKGAYTLDRPLTVIEAVARARGIETGLRDGRTVEVVDFSRSFLARGGQRVPVDFKRLFLEGDLSQNQLLAPGDYLYFAPPNPTHVYVLGEVNNPGLLRHSPDTSALSAVVARGGFTGRAWNRKLLVVRGSLNKPETLVVDAAAVLAAREPDSLLQPGDIVYVSQRPWVKAEELLDAAASAFVQAAVIVWTGGNVGSVFR